MVRTVFIALGSNIEPERHLPAAVRLLAERLRLRGASRVFETVPVGRTDQPNFLNAAVLVETDLPPEVLKFEVLRDVETRLGRVRTSDRNAPRTIDLDIALYANLVHDAPELGLTIPDPDIGRRAHIALPLADLAPTFVHPVTGQTLGVIAAPFVADAGVAVHPLELTA